MKMPTVAEIKISTEENPSQRGGVNSLAESYFLSYFERQALYEFLFGES